MRKTNVVSNIITPEFNTIIFDLNGTITNSVSTHPKHIAYRNNYIRYRTKKPIHQDIPQSTTKALEAYGLDASEYYNYRNHNLNWSLFHSYSENTFQLFSYLGNVGFNIVLYTDCYLSQINPTLNILGLNSFFSLVVSKENGYKKPSINAYHFIFNELDITPRQSLMIANDWKQDLEPLHNIGGNTIWISNEKYLPDAINIIRKKHFFKLKRKTTIFVH
ncbi:MAG: HAD family hydrolase [Vicingus serpentipes]|nr:HAD family hydrolase [Vicingus serpentipes]